LSAASEDSVSFDDCITKELSQFVNFFSRVNPVGLQPFGESLPMRFAAIAPVRRGLPLQRGIDHEAILSLLFETEQFFHQRWFNVNCAA